MTASVEEALEVIDATASLLNALLGNLPVEVPEVPLDGGWSMKDVVAHLLVTDRLGAIGRIQRILAQEAPVLPAFDEETELEKSGLRDEPLSALLKRLTETRRENVELLRALAAPALLRSGRHSEVGVVTVSDLIFHAAYHDASHMRQMASMVQVHFEPLRGGMRAYK